MVTIHEIMYNFEQHIRQSSGDVPHHLSIPVIHIIDDIAYYASFVYFFDNQISTWIYSSLETGEVISYFTCTDIDKFSAFDFEISLSEDECRYQSADVMKKLEALLLDISDDILSRHIINVPKYAYYMSYILTIIPQELCLDYIALSYHPPEMDVSISTETWLPINLDDLAMHDRKNMIMEYLEKIDLVYIVLEKEPFLVTGRETRPFVNHVGKQSIIYLCQSYSAACTLIDTICPENKLSDGTYMIGAINNYIKNGNVADFIHNVEGSTVTNIALGVQVKNNILHHPGIYTCAVHSKDIETEVMMPLYAPHIKKLDYKHQEHFRQLQKVETADMAKYLLQQDIIYIIYSSETSCPYVDNMNNMIVCTDTENAHAVVRSINDNESLHTYIFSLTAPSYLPCFDLYFYAFGFHGITVNPYTNNVTIKNTDILLNRQLSRPESHRMPTNPGLKLALVKYKQKLATPYFPEIKRKIVKAAKINVLEELGKSSLVVPMRSLSRDSEHLSNSLHIAPNEEAVVFPAVGRKDDDKEIIGLPVFTDIPEMMTLYSLDEWSFIPMKGDRIAALDKSDCIVINPTSPVVFEYPIDDYLQYFGKKKGEEKPE